MTTSNDNKPILNLNQIVFDGKVDSLDQRDIDLLLAQKALNFNGLRFDDKRFDFADFSSGSYRGTFFNNCNLSNIVALNDSHENKYNSKHNFNQTEIKKGINKNQLFVFWSFNNSFFYKTLIEKSKFDNCIFIGKRDGLVNFHTVTIKNSSFSNSKEGQLNGITLAFTRFESCRFDDIKFYDSVHFDSEYINCNFYGGLFQDLSFSPTMKNKIIGGYFNNLQIRNCDFSEIIIDKIGLVHPKLKSVQIEGAYFSSAKIDAWFEDCHINSLYQNGDFNSVDFSTSIIENTVFGLKDSYSLFQMKKCDFSKVEFRNSVKFIKCDLTGSTWPSNISSVKFIDCVGNP